MCLLKEKGAERLERAPRDNYFLCVPSLYFLILAERWTLDNHGPMGSDKGTAAPNA
jgi:hypothetical protein